MGNNKLEWPKGKKFAFTIVDDTDNATIENIKPIYDLLHDLKLFTTKTVWVYPSRDRFSGECLQDANYLQFIKDLKNKGFEIGLHGVGSGDFTREEILKGLQLYEDFLGEKPSMHINHAQNSHNLYHGNRGGSKLLQWYAKRKAPNDSYYGEIKESKYYWGDWAKKNIKYTRGRTFEQINTLRQDPLMPYYDKDKLDSTNIWFSSSDGANVNLFNKLITEENVDQLVAKGGLCIVYTHFASDFYKNGKINEEFEQKIRYLASKDGWFVPASELLDYVIDQKGVNSPSQWYFTYLDLREILRNKLNRFFKVSR